MAMTPADGDLEHVFAAIPDEVVGICRRLRSKGKRGWVVGGSVRDLLRGAPVKDWDVATDARPEQVRHWFAKVVPTGLKHGTVTVIVDTTAYELTTLRGEGGYGDGRHPDEVVFLEDIVADLGRRDFTFNAIAVDPIERSLIDPFDGRRDLEHSVLRAVGEPRQRFAEDGLRVLRAARFAATLGCRIEPGTLAAMAEQTALDTLAKVSAERVRDEWIRAMAAPRPSVAFEIMRHAGVLGLHCPELLETIGCQQNRWHAYDVWEHTMAVLDACPTDAVLRVAALLHDVAKPRTRQLSPKTGDYTFYQHELVGAAMADAILRRLKLSNDDRGRVVQIVRHHLICYSTEWTDAAVRRWVRRVTRERLEDMYAIGRADAHGKGRDDDGAGGRAIDDLRRRVEQLLTAGAALSAHDLDIDGTVLMAELGLVPGPIVGDLLRELVEMVTEEPQANEREQLLAEARRLLAERS